MRSPRNPAPPETRARYGVSVVFMVFGTLVGSWLPHIPDVKRHVGANDSVLGWALICSGLGAVVSMQVLGSLIHRFGSRDVAVVGGVGACALIPFLMIQTTVLGLCLNLLCVGLCYGCLDVGMNAHAVQVQALHNRPILSAIHGWFSLGGMVGGFVAALVDRLAVPPLLHLAVTSVVLVSLLFGSRTAMLPSETDQDSEGPKFVFPHGVLLLLGVLCAAAFVIEGGILDWLALYVRDSLKASAAYGGIATGICSGMLATGRFVGDGLLHRFGDWPVIYFSSFLVIFGLVGGVSTSSLWLTILCLSLVCFGLADMAPVFFNEAGKLPGIPTGVGVAALTTCGYGGFLFGPPMIGFIAHRVSLASGIGSLSVLGVIILIGARSFLKRSPVPES